MEKKVNKVNFMSSINHPSIIQRDKINYFVDCLNLITETVGFPFFAQRINIRILCNTLLDILNTTSSSKYLYLYHYYSNYKNHISYKHPLNHPYTALIEKLEKQFEDFVQKKPWDKSCKDYLPNELEKVLVEITRNLNENYFDTIINELKSAIFCKEDLFEHNHILVIEECTKSIIAELYNIGYAKDKIKNIFFEAINNNYENFGGLFKSQILKIPVPPEMYSLQTKISYTKYKNKVRKYVKESSLENQFNNLKYLFYQSQRNRKYLFKIKNLRINSNSEILYNGVLFSRNPSAKYLKKDSLARFKKFFTNDSTCSFCEVEIFNGNEVTAIQQAISKIQEGIDFVYYHVSNDKVKRINKPYLDLSEYVEVDKSTTLITRYGSSLVTTFDVDYLEQLKPLEEIKGSQVVAEYLKLDRIFIGAYALESDYTASSELWRYCESLFDDSTGIKPEEMIKTLINYYLKKRNVHLYTGLQSMLFEYTNVLLHSHESKINELGLTFQQLNAMCNKKWQIKDYVKEFNKIIKHPLINSKKEELFNMKEGKVKEGLERHFTLILKSLNYQRNLYQHSNISIETLKNIWFEESLLFIETLRIHIINDLKLNPKIDKLESLLKA